MSFVFIFLIVMQKFVAIRLAVLAGNEAESCYFYVIFRRFANTNCHFLSKSWTIGYDVKKLYSLQNHQLCSLCKRITRVEPMLGIVGAAQAYNTKILKVI